MKKKLIEWCNEHKEDIKDYAHATLWAGALTCIGILIGRRLAEQRNYELWYELGHYAGGMEKLEELSKNGNK